MATTPPPELGLPTPQEPAARGQDVEEVWETIRPIQPASRFQTLPLAALPPLARHLTIPIIVLTES